MPPKSVPKHTAKSEHLTVSLKLELLSKLDSGKTVAQMCKEYGVKKQTLSDFKRQRVKLEAYAAKFGGREKNDVGRKHMKKCQIAYVDAAVYKWYVQQHSCGAVVCGAELAASAHKIVIHMGLKDFKAGDGWLW